MVESPLLPLDIADNIIEALTLCDPDLTTVKACSLVCHDFLYICRKHIFASITLNPFPAAPLSRNFGWTQKGPTQKFKQLLLDAPHLADYVQELDYTYESQDLNYAAELCQMFAKITRLKYLVIAAAYGLWWNTSPLRPAFLRLFHLPTLVGLEVSAMNGFIVTDLAPCVNLKRFAFTQLWSFASSPNAEAPQVPLNLSEISTGTDSHSVVEQICAVQCADGQPFVDFTSITDITTAMEDLDDRNSSFEMINRCRSLTKVSIDANIPTPDLTLTGLHNALAPSLHTLKHIEIDLFFHSGEPSDDPFCHLADELEKISKGNIMETIQIRAIIDSQTGITGEDACARLDEVLGQAGWRHLRQFLLLIALHVFDEDRVRGASLQQRWQSLEDTHFPRMRRLSSNGLLIFGYQVIAENMYN